MNKNTFKHSNRMEHSLGMRNKDERLFKQALHVRLNRASLLSSPARWLGNAVYRNAPPDSRPVAAPFKPTLTPKHAHSR